MYILIDLWSSTFRCVSHVPFHIACLLHCPVVISVLVLQGDKMEAIAVRQQAHRFNELRTNEVYYFTYVGFEMADDRPPIALKIPRDYYLVLHHRTQFRLVGSNVSIPRLPSCFMDFIDVARLPNKMLTGLCISVFAGSIILYSQSISTVHWKFINVVSIHF